MTERNIDARASQGFSADANELNQQFGDRTSTSTDGGDAAGRDVHKNQNINNFFLLGSELSASTKLDALRQALVDLGLHEDQTRIQQARDAVLPDDAGIWTKAGQDPLAQLQDFDKLSEFLLYLIQDGQSSQVVRERLKTELEAYQKSTGKDPSQLIKHPKTELNNQEINPYLMVVVESVSGSEEEFRVNAWLIPNELGVDFSRRSFKDFKALDLTPELCESLNLDIEALELEIDEGEKGLKCSFSEIQILIKYFLVVSKSILPNKLRKEITIELFLPSQYLSTNIDKWEVSIKKKLLSLRQKHPVIVRSSDRLDEEYLRDCLWTDWAQNWTRMKSCLSCEPSWDMFEPIEVDENCDWEEILDQFQEQEYKVGLIIPCLPCKDSQKELFTEMDYYSVPFAIWLQQSLSGKEDIAELKQLLESGPLATLPQRIQALRHKVRKQPRDKHFAYHLTILWEDPNRLPPTVMSGLQSPRGL